MRKLFFIIFTLTFSTIFCDLPRIWKFAYEGDYVNTHREMLIRESRGVEDVLLKNFSLAYLFYRRGEMNKLKEILSHIDHIISEEFICE